GSTSWRRSSTARRTRCAPRRAIQRRRGPALSSKLSSTRCVSRSRTLSEAGREAAPTAGPRIGRRGMLLILSSPSGAGQTTLPRRLLAADANLRMSVSLTTRAARPGEAEGIDYFFVDNAEFDRRRQAGELLEWAEVFGASYGTPKAQVLDLIEAGTDVVFDID